MANIYEDNSLSIGNTPLVRLKLIESAKVYGKIESRNPSNSVKCRIGANMIWEAEKSGRLTRDIELIEPTSGNTGVALAFVAASKGYKITLTMPHTMSIERRQLMKALGANIFLTDGSLGMKGAINMAHEIAESMPDKYLLLDQFNNPANPQIHEKTTGPEIWEDTGGQIDVLVSGVGTGGTLTGISRYIKKNRGKNITSVAVEPEASPQIKLAKQGLHPIHAPHKIQGIGAGFIPGNLDMDMVDRTVQISDNKAMEFAHRLMKEEGILAGISSGAAVAAAHQITRKDSYKDQTIVVILPDSGERYLTTSLFTGEFTDNEIIQDYQPQV